VTERQSPWRSLTANAHLLESLPVEFNLKTNRTVLERVVKSDAELEVMLGNRDVSTGWSGDVHLFSERVLGARANFDCYYRLLV
jgi:hypothetical protein